MSLHQKQRSVGGPNPPGRESREKGREGGTPPFFQSAAKQSICVVNHLSSGLSAIFCRDDDAINTGQRAERRLTIDQTDKVSLPHLGKGGLTNIVASVCHSPSPSPKKREKRGGENIGLARPIFLSLPPLPVSHLPFFYFSHSLSLSLRLILLPLPSPPSPVILPSPLDI